MNPIGMPLTRFGCFTLVLVTLVACGAGDEAAESEPTPATAEPASDPMMDEMIAHIGHVEVMPPDSMQARLPMHRQMVGNMLARMNAEMRSMNMGADPAWNALVDSIRTDAVQLPELSAPELEATMPAHLGRVTRLLESHRTMMRAMGM